MTFFTEYMQWLDRLLLNYVSSNTAALSRILEPVLVTLGVLYVILWGYLQLIGKIEAPVMEGLKRMLTLALVLAVSLHLWMYNEIIVDLFYDAPKRLMAQVVGADDSSMTIDTILASGTGVAQALLSKGNVFSNNISYFIAGFMVYIAIGLTAVYAIFVLSLSRIALSILLAVGPGFFVFLLFATTRRFFEAWLAQLANYAFIAILIVLAASLMLHLIRVSASQALAMGAGIEIAHAIRVCMAACLAFLVMRQVMPMAASLASGLSLTTFGAVSAAVSWGMAKANRITREFGRGLVNPRSYGGASLISQVGSAFTRSTLSGARFVARRWQTNSVRALR